MYGRTEHSESTETILGVMRMLSGERTTLQALRDDLRLRDYERTDEAWQLLRQASVLMIDAERNLNGALAALPLPVTDEGNKRIKESLGRRHWT